MKMLTLDAPASDQGPALLESVNMVFRLLDELSAVRRPMGVTELASRLAAPKARTYRHLASLRRLGIVEQDPLGDKYRLGPRLVSYGEAACEQFDLRTLATPYLTRIRDLTGQTAMLSVASHGTALVVATVESLANVCVSVKPGNRVMPHCSAQGRTVLAFSDDSCRRLVLERKMTRFTGQTLCSPEQLVERLALIRERLWDIAEGEVTEAIVAVCCPVFRDGARIIGTIGIVGPTASINAHAPDFIKELRAAAADISERLHGTVYRDAPNLF